MEILRKFFYPESICIVGASSKPKSIGYEILKNIRDYGYKGKVFPVNPKADEILSYRCYASVKEINESIDLAIVTIPKSIVVDSVKDLMEKNVKAIILITAGFREIGNEGERLEKQVAEIIKKNGGRLVGPNCMGVINTLPGHELNATFVAEKPDIGSIAFFSQSGALGAAVLNTLRESDVRFAHFISIGNKADVNENDLLGFWLKDDNIHTLTYYLESFDNGINFLLPFIKGEVDKPVIVLKAGRTQSGMKAASSHTGALSSSDKIVNSLLKQFGIIRVKTLNELLNTAKGFEHFPLTRGNRIAVVTNAGGPAILCVDRLEEKGLVLASLNASTKEKIKSIIHPEGSAENPIDLLPSGDEETYKNVTALLLEDENVDAVITIFVEPVMVKPFEIVESIYNNFNNSNSTKPVIHTTIPLPEFWNYYKTNSQRKLPVFKNPEDVPEILSNLWFYKERSTRLKKNRNEYLELINRKGSNLIKTEGKYLTQRELNEIAKKYNLPVVESKILKYEQLIELSDEFFPAVIKGMNARVIHKSEFNAVHLNIKNKQKLLEKAEQIQSSFKENGFEVEEFLVQRYLKIKHELLIGGFRDRSFGPIIMFGSGGKYVEILGDTSIRSCYSSRDDIYEMISETKIGKIIQGARGEVGIKIESLVELIRNCAIMMIENLAVAEFDINPLAVDVDNNLYVADIRLRTI
ncbi:acetate--CoA ligase family protein [Melioribacter sp. OK-6-Me]|uniref:acetate--CoA ligase family protein n=1 Tax=unclassified Melioribacter TaxID=2627329 RepID=UPI003EDA44D0